MAYENTSIKKLVVDVQEQKLYLPAIQRKFVWERQKIELLFDSLMRSYPIGGFLFWRLSGTVANEYVFYKFLEDYDERDPFNKRKEGPFLQDSIAGVLDGQQRISAMYLGLTGTHIERGRYKRANRDDAYQKARLYVNLLSLPYEAELSGALHVSEEINFDFTFLGEEQSRATTRLTVRENGPAAAEPAFWFRVGDALAWQPDFDRDQLFENLLGGAATAPQRDAMQREKRKILKFADTLYARLNDKTLLSYFEVERNDLEDILKIFVRVNSGGVQLTKTDLLFSTIVATWDDGREQIENLQRKINAKGDRFRFTNDFLMRTCLVLTDGPVVFKVTSFKAENVHRIKHDWPAIASAILRAVDLLVEFGFSGELLASQNAVSLIAYHVYKGGSLNASSKDGLKRYLVHALLKTVFGGSSDQVLVSLRNALRVEEPPGEYTLRKQEFDFEEVARTELPDRKSLRITEEDLDAFLTYRKGAGAFLVLTMLYPHLRYADVSFHQDHLHPHSGFNEVAFDALQLSVMNRQEWLEFRDQVPNLQLLEGRENSSKNATSLQDWVESIPEELRTSRLTTSFIPPTGLSFENFPEFYRQRRELLRVALAGKLSVHRAPAELAPIFGRLEDEIGDGVQVEEA